MGIVVEKTKHIGKMPEGNAAQQDAAQQKSKPLGVVHAAACVGQQTGNQTQHHKSNKQNSNKNSNFFHLHIKILAILEPYKPL